MTIQKIEDLLKTATPAAMRELVDEVLPAMDRLDQIRIVTAGHACLDQFLENRFMSSGTTFAVEMYGLIKAAADPHHPARGTALINLRYLCENDLESGLLALQKTGVSEGQQIIRNVVEAKSREYHPLCLYGVFDRVSGGDRAQVEQLTALIPPNNNRLDNYVFEA